MNNVRMSDEHVSAVGKLLSSVILGVLAAMFAYAYLGHMLHR
jgi:hypothetical protein